MRLVERWARTMWSFSFCWRVTAGLFHPLAAVRGGYSPCPSAKLYIPADKISSINLNYEPEIPSSEAVTRLVKEKTGTEAPLSFTFSKSETVARPKT
jgi:hypothetical protein